jgi:two-component system LytT family response regulator
VDYLLKPIDEDRLYEALERVRSAFPYRLKSKYQANEHYLETLTVRIGNRILLVNATDISWIAADGDYVTLYVGTKQYLLRETIHKLIQKLNPNSFIRIHRSTIVKIDQVSELRSLNNRDALLRLQDGTPLRVSRTYIDILIESLRRIRGCAIGG